MLYLLLLLEAFHIVNGLKCHVCNHNYNIYQNSWDIDCLYKAKLASISKYQMECPPHQKSCMTEIVLANGVMYSVLRRCAKECSRKCDNKGYGVDWKTCSTCCSSDLCNSNTGTTYYNFMSSWNGANRPSLFPFLFLPLLLLPF